MAKGVVLITGSSKGLGRDLALVFASAGYDLILHGRSNPDLAAVRKMAVSKGVRCLIIRGDFRQDRVIKRLVKAARLNNISVLINNAGLHCPHLPLQKIKDKLIDDILLTNLVAPVKLTKGIYSLFFNKRRGAIININSLSGLKNQEHRSIYCASKWGLRGFADSLSLEAKKRGVRIIDVYPSRIKTRPSFTYGMPPEAVAKKIFNAYQRKNKDRIIIG